MTKTTITANGATKVGDALASKIFASLSGTFETGSAAFGHYTDPGAQTGFVALTGEGAHTANVAKVLASGSGIQLWCVITGITTVADLILIDAPTR